MSLLQDAKHDTLRTQLGLEGHVNDLELAWVQALGATSNNLVDAWFEVFEAAAITEGNFNDRAVAYIVSIVGAPPSDDYNAHWLHYWQNATLGPPVPPPPFPTVSPLLHWFDFTDGSTVFSDLAGTIPAIDGDTIQHVTNKGQDGTPLVQSAPTSAPEYRVGAFGGLNMADFNHYGRTRALLSRPIPNGYDPRVEGLTIVAVARINNPTFDLPAGQSEIFAWGGAYRLNVNNPAIPGDDDVTALWSPENQVILQPYVPDTFYLFYQSVDIADVDDAFYASPGPEAPGNTNNPTLFDIANNTTLEIDFITAEGDVLEVMWYRGPLTAAERAALVGYVTGKYGALPALGPDPVNRPPFFADVQHWWDPQDIRVLWQNTNGTGVPFNGGPVRRIDDKGSGVGSGFGPQNLADAASGLTYSAGADAIQYTAGALPGFTSAALPGQIGGTNGMTVAGVWRDIGGSPTQVFFYLDNGPSNISIEKVFGNWAEEHPNQGTTGSGKAVVNNEWVWHYWTDGIGFGFYRQRVSGAAEVNGVQGYLNQAATPIELLRDYGQIREIIVYQRDLSAAELVTLVNYLINKHNTITFPP